MARILGIDYGLKRCGLAKTDPLQLIVSGLESVPTESLLEYLEEFMNNESVEKIVIGYPTHRDGTETTLVDHINMFANNLKLKFHNLEIDFQNENFSSVMAKKLILDSGVKKQKRKAKGLTDKISAVIILQKYLGHI